jgi:hypothetical protein
MEQQIHFCTTDDQVRIAYATVGKGPPLVKAAGADTLAGILADELSPLAAGNPGTPPELQRIVTRTLQKKRSERYQTVKELLADLRALKQECQFRARLSSTTWPGESYGTSRTVRSYLTSAKMFYRQESTAV